MRNKNLIATKKVVVRKTQTLKKIAKQFYWALYLKTIRKNHLPHKYYFS